MPSPAHSNLLKLILESVDRKFPGRPDVAKSWCVQPNRNFGGLAPVDLMKTEEGSKKLLDFINDYPSIIDS